MIKNFGGWRPWRHISGHLCFNISRAPLSTMIQCMKCAFTTHNSIYRGRPCHLWFNAWSAPLPPMIQYIEGAAGAYDFGYQGRPWLLTEWCPRLQSLTPNVESALVAPIDDMLLIMLLLLRYHLLFFFCRAQTIFSVFNQVSSSVWKEQSKNVPWCLWFCVSKAHLAHTIQSIVGAPGAYGSVYQGRQGVYDSIQHDSIYGPRSYTWIQFLTQDLKGPLGRLLMIYYLFRVLLRADVRVLSTFIPPF